jgi:hypothetical protein
MRRWVLAGTVVLTGAAAGLAAVVVQHGGSPAVFQPTTHRVSYEVSGQGMVPDISYSADASGNLVLVRHPTLPWRTTVTIPVGLTAGNANVESGNAVIGGPAEAPPLTCRIWVDGKLVAQRTTTDGFSDAACSTTLRPKQG